MRKVVIMGILTLFAILAISAASASEYYLVPDNSGATFCGSEEIQLWINGTDPISAGKITILSDPLCGDITGFTCNGTFFNCPTSVIKDNGGRLVITFVSPGVPPIERGPGDYHIGNFTLHCNSSDCITDLIFKTSGYATDLVNNTVPHLPFTTDNGTFTCMAPQETFSKDLYDGWNLVSLPLTPSNNSTSSVLASVWDNVSAVYRYNATSKQFESASTMDSGIGYFVHVTQNCTWTYSGTPYTSMSTELKQGLNMVGWLNCSEDITDALSSIAGDYWYVARWNAVSQSFEVYNPVAPSSFNDFTAMDRGTGYFISAKADTTLSASC